MIKGIPIENLVVFLKIQSIEKYLPPKTRKGRDAKLDRNWVYFLS
jgi:hypothetical protein